MTAHTDDDVTAGGDAIIAARVECYGNETAARAVLAAVAPAIAARALREAADDADRKHETEYDPWYWTDVSGWLRARAEAVDE